MPSILCEPVGGVVPVTKARGDSSFDDRSIYGAVAPGGVEPPRVDSKSTALSAELRGQRESPKQFLLESSDTHAFAGRGKPYVESRRPAPSGICSADGLRASAVRPCAAKPVRPQAAKTEWQTGAAAPVDPSPTSERDGGPGPSRDFSRGRAAR